MYKNRRAEHGEQFRTNIQITTLDPLQRGRQQQRYRLDYSKDATSVLETFHIVTLAGDAPGEVRRRVQQDTLSHRGRTGDPLSPGPQSLARLTHASSPPRANKNAGRF